MKELIQVQQLFKSYGNGTKRVEVLKGLDLTFSQGEKAAIVGASGVGKTTLLHVLGTLDRPTAGKVLYEGKDIYTLNEKDLAFFRNREIGFVFQFHHLLPEFNALENTMMPCLIQGLSKKEAAFRAEAILTLVGLKERLSHKPGELSGGEQQRVAVARALVLEPKVLLADEPTGNLDTKTGDSVFDLLQKLNHIKGVTLIVVTHNLKLAENMARQIQLVDGKALIENAHFTKG
ncbi:MAG: ABC transporter ATP-binding protein [Deltaproteobacteria bacterium RBG_19FT_COMBO_46_12]|nr:MAG: ABC transporter ATP-binding protein [Deltaproteobacteria bacterium RBG_19FT_COMBO_46_12]